MTKEIITEDELTDMFGEGGKEEVREYYENEGTFADHLEEVKRD